MWLFMIIYYDYYCSKCGAGVPSTRRVCSRCGTSTYIEKKGTYIFNYYICEFCGIRFEKKSALNTHILIHPQCGFCGIRVDDKSALNIHILNHHICEICGIWVENKSALTTHILIHPQCEICGSLNIMEPP